MQKYAGKVFAHYIDMDKFAFARYLQNVRESPLRLLLHFADRCKANLSSLSIIALH